MRQFGVIVAVQNCFIGLLQPLTGQRTGSHGTAYVQRSTPHIDQRFNGDQQRNQRDRQTHSRQNDQRGKRCTATDTRNPCGTHGHDTNQRGNPHWVQRVDSNGRRDHYCQHCRVQTRTTILANRGAKRGGERGDGFRHAQTTGLRFNVQRN